MKNTPELTKRELFAAMAMQGLLANTRFVSTTEQHVEDCLHFADALLIALQQSESKGNSDE